MAITYKTKFSISWVDNNAFAIYERNTIEIGCKTMTIETFIHEVNEIEVMNILKRFGYNKDAKIGNKRYFVSHILSPYGKDTLIEPHTREQLENNEIVEEFLE